MRVVILATRIAGTDGVSLEANRWREIFERMGHQTTFVAGELDTSGVLIPELHFQWPRVVELHDKVVYGKNNYREIEREIFEVAGKIEGKLRETFNRGKSIDLLVVPNALSIPMHFPLAVALTRVVEELNIPTIARHHDFWWERKRFLRSTMFPFFKRWFPPDLPTVKHVVINSVAKRELKKRTNLDAELIWDCFDFSSKKNNLDSYSKHWRKDFGLKDDDIVFLQATRIVPRKRIELSIELVKKIDHPNVVLVMAGYSGDEGHEYEKMLRKKAREAGIRYKFIGERINAWRKIKSGKRIYTLWDCFVNADFVTYPTKVEGFGNQFVEAVYFRKPIVLTPYPVYKEDIRPLGFKVIEMPGRVSEKAVEGVRQLLANPKKVQEMAQKNFKLGKKYFSYKRVEKKLRKMIYSF